MLTVERSKRQIEAISISADFADRMAAGDTISSYTISIAVFARVDPSPADMLYLPPIVDAQTITQRVKQGVVGVIYDVQFEVVTAAGYTLEQTTRLAILPNAPGAIPEYIPLYFTSWPYPVEATDGAQFSLQLPPSRLRPQVFFVPEATSWALELQAGTLIGALKSYAGPPEWIYTNLEILSGTLIASLKTYTNPPEGVLVNLSLQSGTLISGLVSYSIPNEGVSFGLSLLPGTLS